MEFSLQLLRRPRDDRSIWNRFRTSFHDLGRAWLQEEKFKEDLRRSEGRRRIGEEVSRLFLARRRVLSVSDPCFFVLASQTLVLIEIEMELLATQLQPTSFLPFHRQPIPPWNLE